MHKWKINSWLSALPHSTGTCIFSYTASSSLGHKSEGRSERIWMHWVLGNQGAFNSGKVDGVTTNNPLTGLNYLVYVFQYDFTHRNFHGMVKAENGKLVINEAAIIIFQRAIPPTSNGIKLEPIMLCSPLVSLQPWRMLQLIWMVGSTVWSCPMIAPYLWWHESCEEWQLHTDHHQCFLHLQLVSLSGQGHPWPWTLECGGTQNCSSNYHCYPEYSV